MQERYSKSLKNGNEKLLLEFKLKNIPFKTRLKFISLSLLFVLIVNVLLLYFLVFFPARLITPGIAYAILFFAISFVIITIIRESSRRLRLYTDCVETYYAFMGMVFCKKTVYLENADIFINYDNSNKLQIMSENDYQNKIEYIFRSGEAGINNFVDCCKSAGIKFIKMRDRCLNRFGSQQCLVYYYYFGHIKYPEGVCLDVKNSEKVKTSLKEQRSGPIKLLELKNNERMMFKLYTGGVAEVIYRKEGESYAWGAKTNDKSMAITMLLKEVSVTINNRFLRIIHEESWKYHYYFDNKETEVDNVVKCFESAGVEFIKIKDPLSMGDYVYVQKDHLESFAGEDLQKS